MMQMAETQEWGLVKRYANDGSQAAFRALVDRYAGLVYSTCLREVGDRQVAEDATQATFLVLATKANALRPSGPLSAWLFTTARLVSKNARRRHLAQKKLEQAAMDEFLTQQQQSGGDEWSAVSDNLHAAMDKLSAADRQAILLRFFEQLSMRETADALGIAEPAAKKRVGRALDRLRLRLSGRQVLVPAIALAALLTDRAVDAAPDTCLSALHAINYPTALPLAAGHVLPAHAHEYAKGALKIMKTTTQKVTTIAIAGTAVALLTVGAGLYGAVRVIHPAKIYASVPTPPDGWLLRAKYVAGKSYNYQIKQTVNTATTMPSGQLIPNKVDMVLGYTNDVQAVDSNGDATVAMQISVDSITSGGRSIALPPATLAQITRPAVFRVTSRGKVAKSAASDPSNSILESLSTNECFPEKAVKPGDTWTSSMSMYGSVFSIQVALKDVVEKGGHKVAMIHEDLKRTSAPSGANQATGGISQLGFDTAAVDAEYDVDTGLTLATRTTAVSTMSAPTPQGPAHIVATTDQTLTLLNG